MLEKEPLLPIEFLGHQTEIFNQIARLTIKLNLVVEEVNKKNGSHEALPKGIDFSIKKLREYWERKHPKEAERWVLLMRICCAHNI